MIKSNSAGNQTFSVTPLARSIRTQRWGKTGAAAVALGALVSGNVYAVESIGLEEVIVTAQKRSQSLQDVPISMAVLGETSLEDNGVVDLQDFAQLMPSMNYVTTGPGTGNVYMRGISGGGESALGASPNVAVYMDEQPVTTANSFLNPHVYDINRIETLAGPQGTLFGANSQAGSIRIITNKPDPGEFSAGYDLELNSVKSGDTGTLAEGFVNIPIGDNAAIRLVGWRKDEAGFIDNVLGTHTFDLSGIREGWQTGNGTNADLVALTQDQTISNDAFVEDDFNEATTTGGRASLRFDLNENWTVTAGVMRQELESEGVWDHDPTKAGDLEVIRFQPDTNDDEWTQLSLVIEGQIAGMTLTYAGSDLDRESEQQADYSLYSDPSNGSPGFVVGYYACYVAYFGVCADPTLLYTGDQKFERTSHELRLASPQENKLRWLVGVFYEENSHDFDLDWHVLGLAGITPDVTGAGTPAFVETPDIYWTTDQLRESEETAIFGEISYDITEKLNVAFSTRFFDSDITLLGFSGTVWWPDRYGPRTEDFNTDLKTDDQDNVSKLNASYQITEDVMVYGSWSEGYRPGGLNRVYNTPIGGPFEPDFLTAWEIGVKTTMLDGRLRFNAAAYTQDWDDFQLSKIDQSVSVLTLTDNVGNAESNGFELDGTFLIKNNWSMNFGLSWIDSTLAEPYWVNAASEAAGNPPEAKKGAELPRVPDLKWNMATRYNFDMMGMNSFVQASYTYTGESYNLLYGPTPPARTRDKQHSYQVLNLAVGVEAAKWSAELYVKNLDDERGEVFINGNTYDSRITVNRPRTIGLRWRQKFE